MTQQSPRIEARVSALERRQINTDARIEELASDVAESFKAQSAYQVRIEQKIDGMEGKIDHIETEISTIKADMVAMEGRILGAFQQLVTIIDQRLPAKGE